MGFSCLINAGSLVGWPRVQNASSPSQPCLALALFHSRRIKVFHRYKQPSTLHILASSAAQSVQESAAASSHAKEARTVRKSKERPRTFKFRPAHGSEVTVTVAKEDNNHVVSVTFVTMKKEEQFYMHWNIFRSSSSNSGKVDLKDVPAGTSKINEIYQTSLQEVAPCVHSVQLQLSSSYAPFYLGFHISKQLEGRPQEISTRLASGEAHFVFPVGCGRGHPEPLGSSVLIDGSFNFALYSKRAVGVILCLYHPECTQPSVELELQPSINRTGNTWHIELDNVGMFDRYGYRCKGESSWANGNRFHARRILLDPYAKHLAPFLPGQDTLPSPASVLGLLTKEEVLFDWEDDVYPEIPLEEVVAYRLNVTDFTGNKSSGLQDNVLGTFDALGKKLHHFKSLGVNSIILEPIFFGQKKKSSLHPLSFFAPMDCFGPEKTSVSSSFSLKKAIKELHKNHIEVLLDVVFTSTGENNDEAPETVSFRGIDNATYYILDQKGRVSGSDMGASNCFNCNHPVTHSMILDSLRHWVIEYHIDGFCFLNASLLTKGPHGEELSRPLLVEAISFDPILSKTKLFADTSSPFTRISKDFTFPHWKRWCLWNNKYKEEVRQFMRGDKGQLSCFATRLCGSGDLLGDGRGPSYSLNHVTSPYGLTLVDLVSYSAKKAADSERSWNCGEQGRTLNQAVLNIRVKQVRNFLMCLFLSQGTPVLNMGDECGLSKGGSLSVDERKAFNWDSLKLDFGKQTMCLIALLIAFRARRKDIFQRKEFVKLENIHWHGVEVNEPDWESADSTFIAVTLSSEVKAVGMQSTLGEIYIGFNSGDAPAMVSLPEPSLGMNWYRIADSSLPFPQNFQEKGVPLPIPPEADESVPNRTYQVQSYSSILLEARAMP